MIPYWRCIHKIQSFHSNKACSFWAKNLANFVWKPLINICFHTERYLKNNLKNEPVIVGLGQFCLISDNAGQIFGHRGQKHVPIEARLLKFLPGGFARRTPKIRKQNKFWCNIFFFET